METSDSIKRLLGEVGLLSREERDQLIYSLISQKLEEERTPDEVEELPDGAVRKTYWVRPEERRTIRGKRYDYFMGLLEFNYTPPAKRDYARQVLEHWSGIPRHYFRSPESRDPVNTVFVRPMSEESAEQFISELAKKKGISSQTFIRYVDELIEVMSENIFWELAKRCEKAIQDAQSDLMYEIESHLLKKMGISLQSSEKKGDVSVVKMMKGEVMQKQIEHPRHRPKNSKQDPEEFKEQLILILYDLISSGHPVGQITLSVMCERLKPITGAIGVPALRVRLRNCGIEDWKEFRESIVQGWKNKTRVFLEATSKGCRRKFH